MVTKKQGAGKKAAAEKPAEAATKPEKGTKKPAAEKGAAPAAEAGVRLSKGQDAKPEAVHKALGLFGVAKGETLAESVAILREHLATRFKSVLADDRIKCDVCGEISTEDTSFCPYCGDEGEEAPVDPAAAETKSDALAREVETNLAEKAAELDTRRDRIRLLAANLSENSYDLGLEIKAVYDSELWKAKGHRSFKDWYESEIDLSKTVAYRLMDLVHQFDRKTFIAAGPSKLALVATIEDKATRENALEAATAGKTRREIADLAGKSEKPSKSESTKAEKAEKPKKEDGKITLLAKVDGKATTYQFRSAKNGKPVKKHGEDAYVEIRLSEDVVQRVALKVDADGTIVGVTVAYARAGEATAAAAE